MTADYLRRVKANVPPELLTLPVWLLWREKPNGRDKPDKVPHYANGQPRAGDLDSPEDRKQLVTFREAAEAYRNGGKFTGLGVALGPVDERNLCGIDFDGLDLNSERGRGLMQDMAGTASSYVETSPSGKGFHVLGWGTPEAVAKAGLEVYSRGRYFTVTGERYGNRATLANIEAAAQRARELLLAEGPGQASTDDPQGDITANRNVALTSIAGYLWNAPHMNAEALADALQAVNLQRCKPPLELREVRNIAKSVAKRRQHTVRAAEPVEVRLEAFDRDALLAKVEPERELLPGMVPVAAYTLIAGALSTGKTTFLHGLMLWRATGHDMLALCPGLWVPPGPCVLVSYEDDDHRITRRFQMLVQYVTEMLPKEKREQLLDLLTTNMRRVTLTGQSAAGLVTKAGNFGVLENRAFTDELLDKVSAFASADVMVGIDPLRLAIQGSQNDDDGADVVVHTLNRLAGSLPNSGLVIASHTTKAQAKEGGGRSYADAAYATSGSALYSQHARSNFHMARLDADVIRKLFPPDLFTAAEVAQQRVVVVRHGRLSHGAEGQDRFYRMGAAVLVPVQQAEAMTAMDKAKAYWPAFAEAAQRIVEQGGRLSQRALEEDELLSKTLGGRTRLRGYIKLVEGQGWFTTTGRGKALECTLTGPVAEAPEADDEIPF